MTKKIVEIISVYTRTPIQIITSDTDLRTELNIKSLDFVDMIDDLEVEFNCSIPERDFKKLTTIRNIAAYIYYLTS